MTKLLVLNFQLFKCRTVCGETYGGFSWYETYWCLVITLFDKIVFFSQNISCLSLNECQFSLYSLFTVSLIHGVSVCCVKILPFPRKQGKWRFDCTLKLQMYQNWCTRLRRKFSNLGQNVEKMW